MPVRSKGRMRCSSCTGLSPLSGLLGWRDTGGAPPLSLDCCSGGCGGGPAGAGAGNCLCAEACGSLDWLSADLTDSDRFLRSPPVPGEDVFLIGVPLPIGSPFRLSLLSPLGLLPAVAVCCSDPVPVSGGYRILPVSKKYACASSTGSRGALLGSPPTTTICLPTVVML